MTGFEMTATYSPDDNKLRLYSVSRFDTETYTRVRAAGFIWAGKQKLWVAPAWTPQREDLCLELAGEIGDEDTSLVDRAEERADRFEGYHEKRQDEAEGARVAVDRITSGIPLGQPILVGHHSERHARRDAERIEAGMRKALRLWDTAKYWKSRAAGARANAKYKERSDVRARRIKGLESDKRREERRIAQAETFTKLWSREGLTLEQALQIANHDHVGGYGAWSDLRDGKVTVAETVERRLAIHARQIADAQRWLVHIENRLAYERDMLEEAGGLAAERFDLELGGRVLVRREWVVIVRINRKAGRVMSVRTNRRYCSLVNVEEIMDYQPPAEGMAERVKAATKLPPLCNYPGPGFVEMTKADFKRLTRATDFAGIEVIKATAEHGAHRRRRAPGSAAGKQYWDTVAVYITDEKRKDPPPVTSTPPTRPSDLGTEPTREMMAGATKTTPKQDEAAPFRAMADTLRAGVQVAVADQLFPTPPALAARMVELADIGPGMSVLEPSAGTGVLLELARAAGGITTAVELDMRLCDRLRLRFDDVHQADFLKCEPERFGGLFQRIVMNPPFAGGIDVAHIRHACGLLAPGGRLVALCAAGPRQRQAFELLADTWEELPEGTFKDQGTGVRVALLTLSRSHAS